MQNTIANLRVEVAGVVVEDPIVAGVVSVSQFIPGHPLALAAVASASSDDSRH